MRQEWWMKGIQRGTTDLFQNTWCSLVTTGPWYEGGRGRRSRREEGGGRRREKEEGGGVGTRRST
jgi:hypothetical protein